MGELRANSSRRSEIATRSDQFLSKIEPLVDAGFAIVLLREQSKAPMDKDWSTAPVPTFSQLKRWYTSGQNAGVRLGKWSKVKGLYLHVLDVDIKDAKHKKNAIAALDNLFPDVDWRALPRVKSGSGGPSFHVYFLCSEPFPSKKIAKNNAEKWEIEFFGTGKQVVVPPSVHPITGHAYKWVVEPDFDPKQDQIDAAIVEELVFGEDGPDGDRKASIEKTDLTIDEIKDILDEMQDWANDRDKWLRVGMALKHQLGEAGWPLFDEWSKNGEGYDRKRNRIDWNSFKNNHRNPVTLRTLIREYRNRIRLAEFESLDEDQDDDREVNDGDGPAHLLRVPGELQAIVDFYNENSLVEQPQFAVLAALAFGSVVLGRNNVTDFNNYASIYLMGIGESGAGKESIRSTVFRHLRACGFDNMIAPEEMTSEGALLTKFTQSPKVIIPTDEYGLRLAADRASTDSHRQKVQSAYLNIFGALDSTWQPTQYSGQGKSKEEIEAILSRRINRPAPTLMFTSTPSTFFSAIGRGDVKAGFMSRFVVVQGRAGLQRQRIFKPRLTISSNVVKWARFVACRAGDPDEDLLLRVDQAAEVTPFLVPFTRQATKMIDDIEAMRFDKMVELRDSGLNEILNRSREITHRIAMVVALSDDYDQIHRKHLAWAWDFVLHHALRTIDVFSSNLGHSELHLMADKLAQMVKEAGERGITGFEFTRKHTAYKSLNTRDRREVEELMKRDHGIIEHSLTGKRAAFLAPKFVKVRKQK